MKITKQRLVCFLRNAIDLLDKKGIGREEIKKEIGITHSELWAVIQGTVEDDLTPEERYKIAREVDRADKLNDIITRVNELDESESSCLNGYSATEIIKDESLLDEILRRYEKSEAWVDNSDQWYLIDECIKDVMKIERRTKE